MYYNERNNKKLTIRVLKTQWRNDMSELKFQITPKRFTGESTVVSMRLPKDMLRQIDEIAEKTGRTRNEFLTMSLEYALEHLEIKEN